MPRELQPLAKTQRPGAVARRIDAAGAVRSGRLLHVLAVAGALSAAAAFAVADADGRLRWGELLSVNALQIASTVGAAFILRRAADRTWIAPLLSPLLVAVVAATLAWEPVCRWLLDSGRPFEWIVMLNLKNVTLALAAAGCWPRFQRLSFLAGMFLSLFASATTTDLAAHLFATANVACGVLWLIAAHWESLQDRLLSDSRERRPRRALVIGAAIILAMLATIPTSANQLASALRGILPSSGGDGRQDPYAPGGVGDGDALVAGSEHVTSFAPIEDAPFISDEMPALYDVFNDTYEPPVLSRQQDRAVSLPPELARELRQRMARSEQAHREFSTLRQGPTRQRRTMSDISSDALMHIAGRTPLHLRLQLYDVFDGITWYPEPEPDAQPPLFFEVRDGKPWLYTQWHLGSFDCFQPAELHTVKVVRLKTNRIPAPLHLAGVHIDLVERSDLFCWSQQGIVQMERKSLPASVPIHLSSQILVDRESVPNSSAYGATRSPHTTLPGCPEMDEVRRLAEAWTRNVPPGWPQVEAITRRLRESYIHDPSAAAPVDSSFPVGDFLLRSRRGPDYQFATAAAIMLRSLGYSTRVVSGFYARSEKYDPRTRHTPIHADDVHFWVEIYLGSRIWATVEPTPGYDVLGPPLGIQDRILAALTGLLEWARTHWLLLSVGLAGAIAVLRTRLLWLNALHTICWHCSRCQSPRRHVLATWRLLDRRLAWAGWRRPEWCPPREWCRRLPAAEVDLRAALIAVTELADWARFAPRDAAADFRAAAELRSVCGRAVSLSSLTRLQRLAPRKRATRCSGATSRVADRAARQLPDTNPTWNAA